MKNIRNMRMSQNEIIMKNSKETKRYPNLNTVLMVEDFLKEHRDLPIKISELKRRLPRKVMHQTLMVILDYLQLSGKILIGTKGVQWTYASRENIEKMMRGALEI